LEKAEGGTTLSSLGLFLGTSPVSKRPDESKRGGGRFLKGRRFLRRPLRERRREGGPRRSKKGGREALEERGGKNNSAMRGHLVFLGRWKRPSSHSKKEKEDSARKDPLSRNLAVPSKASYPSEKGKPPSREMVACGKKKKVKKSLRMHAKRGQG